MSILNKLMDTMRLTENDDDYFDEEDYEEEKPVIKKRSFGKRDEEMDDYRHEEESKPRFLPRSSNNKVVQMRRSMERHSRAEEFPSGLCAASIGAMICCIACSRKLSSRDATGTLLKTGRRYLCSVYE